MMRRNSTSRRVQTLSSPSIRSDDIADTSMLSRAWSRGEVSDMPPAAGDRQIGVHDRTHDAPGRQNQPLTLVSRGPRCWNWKRSKIRRLKRGNSMAIKFGRPIEARDMPRREAATSAPALDLTIRPRRNRKAEWARRMVRENVLTTDDLIWPLFVTGGHNTRAPVASMPGVDRLSVDQIVRDAERAMKLDIPCLALFPYTDPHLRDEQGSEAVNPDNLVCQSVRAIKKEFPDIGILCDVALDPF